MQISSYMHAHFDRRQREEAEQLKRNIADTQMSIQKIESEIAASEDALRELESELTYLTKCLDDCLNTTVGEAYAEYKYTESRDGEE